MKTFEMNSRKWPRRADYYAVEFKGGLMLIFLWMGLLPAWCNAQQTNNTAAPAQNQQQGAKPASGNDGKMKVPPLMETAPDGKAHTTAPAAKPPVPHAAPPKPMSAPKPH
jgi:hypothetical protein